MSLQRHPGSILVLLTAASLVQAEGIAIDHREVGCVVAGRFPQLLARFDPVDAVAKARVAFRPTGELAWYSVPMKQDGYSFVGVLPQPEKSLKKFDY